MVVFRSVVGPRSVARIEKSYLVFQQCASMLNVLPYATDSTDRKEDELLKSSVVRKSYVM